MNLERKGKYEDVVKTDSVATPSVRTVQQMNRIAPDEVQAGDFVIRKMRHPTGVVLMNPVEVTVARMVEGDADFFIFEHEDGRMLGFRTDFECYRKEGKASKGNSFKQERQRKVPSADVISWSVSGNGVVVRTHTHSTDEEDKQ